ncbi:MAG: FG-GAP-like repeat-containing protein [Ignavibacteriaceae bacterium]
MRKKLAGYNGILLKTLRFTFYITILFILFSVQSYCQVCQSPEFDPALNFDVDLYPTSVTVCDFNRDGFPDLAVTNSLTYKVSLLLGDGSGNFGTAIDLNAGTYPTSITVGDFNGDENPDLVTISSGRNNGSVLLGDGKGSFSGSVIFSVGKYPTSLSVGDFNGDNAMDLVVANYNIAKVSVLLNTAKNFDVTGHSLGVTVGDFDKDNNADIAVTNAITNNISVLLGDGTGNFGTATNFYVGKYPTSITTVVYTGHDGGISLTNDITTSLGGNEPVVWTSLNNGYHSTQFYSISLAPESGSNAMMGGMQDNGTWFGDEAGSSNWSYYESGDGTIVEVAPSADDRVYTAYQNGGVRRRTRAGVYLADFTPNSYNNLFVNPQALDPNNSSLFYYAGGGNLTVAGVWRNDNVINATRTTGWSYLNSTSIGYYVTAIGVSTSNNANVVYYGSDTGPINRIDGANSGKNLSVTAVKGTLPDGYVSCIAVDPTNSGNVLLIFSNYNIQSLWYSTDSGINWTDVEGNLAGASGPSIRCATIFYIDGIPHYFLATSIGIFFTTVLNGVSTVWTQEAVSKIGNVVCTMLDWRDNDGTLAVATHGLGIFTTQITSPLPVELSSFTANIYNNTVQLNWRTESEVNNYGFEINRKPGSEDTKDNKWTKIGFVEGSGNSNSTKDYSYTDRTVGYGRYNYRLKQIDNDGQFNYSDVVQVDMGTLPGKFDLEQNYPNPFNPSTKIRFASASVQDVILKIYDITGNYVTTLFNGKATANRTYEVEFNGSEFASGVYIYQLQAGKTNISKKMILLR